MDEWLAVRIDLEVTTYSFHSAMIERPRSKNKKSNECEVISGRKRNGREKLANPSVGF